MTPSASAVSDRELRAELARQLAGGAAHATFDHAVAGLPARRRGALAPGLPWSPWMLLEHLRLAQFDILDFCRNPKYRQRRWPEDYWPKTPAPPSDAAWRRSVAAFRRDLRAMARLVSNPKTDLFAAIPWWHEPLTVLREAILVVDHNAYHVGQLIAVRRALGTWKD